MAYQYTALSINSEPKGAGIWIDRKGTGKKTPAEIEVVPKADKTTFRVLLLKKGYQDYTKDVSVTRGTTKLVKFTLHKGTSSLEEEEEEEKPKFRVEVVVKDSKGATYEISDGAKYQDYLTRYSVDNAIQRMVKEGTARMSAPAPAKSDFMKKVSEFADNISKGDFVKAALNLVSLPFSSILPTDAKTLTLEYPLSLSKEGIAAEQIVKLMGSGKVASTADIFISTMKQSPKTAVKLFDALSDANKEAVIKSMKNTAVGREFANQLIRGYVKAKIPLSWWKKFLVIIGGAAVVIGVVKEVSFIEFLYEESLQTAGFGVYAAISNKQWDAADKALKIAEGVLDTANFVYNTFGWLSPQSWNVYKTYAKATRMQYDVYRKVINAKTGVVSSPTASGKVFNVTEAKTNIEKGVAPVADSLVAGVVTEEKPAPAPAPEEELPPAPAEKITKAELFNAFKSFYEGRMYMSKRELSALLKNYDTSEITDFIDEVWSYYTGRMYLSKKELIALGTKYGFDVSGL